MEATQTVNTATIVDATIRLLYNLIEADVAKVYGYAGDYRDSYIRTKYRLAINKPFVWYGSLDLVNQRRFAAIVDARIEVA